MFKNRNDAGAQLAVRLSQYKDREDVLILALPRGGVVIGYELAQALNAPLDVLIVRKIGYPGQEELAIGAISETGSVVLNQSIIAVGHPSEGYIKAAIERQKHELSRRVQLYRAGKGLPALAGKIALLVDDGVATGATIKAAIETLKQEKLARLVVALPVGPTETVDELRAMVDEVVCLETPLNFMAVGIHYQDFTQVSDQEVVDLLKRSTAKAA
jgi:putative phosphoribosyl transferase